MASERTLALRTPRTEPRILQQGPTITELVRTEGLVSANRKNRLKADKLALTRAQRMELARKRHERRWLGVEPESPEWAKAKPDAKAKPQHVAATIKEVRGLFERDMVESGESFDSWCARNFGVDSSAEQSATLRSLLNVTIKQLDCAVGEIVDRLKDTNAEGATDG